MSQDGDDVDSGNSQVGKNTLIVMTGVGALATFAGIGALIANSVQSKAVANLIDKNNANSGTSKLNKLKPALAADLSDEQKKQLDQFNSGLKEVNDGADKQISLSRLLNIILGVIVFASVALLAISAFKLYGSNKRQNKAKQQRKDDLTNLAAGIAAANNSNPNVYRNNNPLSSAEEQAINSAAVRRGRIFGQPVY